ncbi:MAG: hypothetical protein KIT27_05600 [Legionellales bacterium]|nr:hypothetical protein [Legionellales bacterium]
MGENSVFDFDNFINEQIESREEMTVILAKLESLIVVAMHIETISIHNVILNNYFCLMSDLLQQCITLNERALHRLFERR